MKRVLIYLLVLFVINLDSINYSSLLSLSVNRREYIIMAFLLAAMAQVVVELKKYKIIKIDKS